jgi:hypothetical protein
MQQLTGADASFLYFETANAPGHVFSVWVYDQSTRSRRQVTFKGILEHVRQRLHVSRTFRQRLVQVPMGLDHPYWIEDPDFDLEYHVRHIALPHPGTGVSSASRWRDCTHARSTSAGRCGRCTSSRGSTTSRACRGQPSPS